MSFIAHARFDKFLDASADFDAQTQESKQGTMLLKLGEFSQSYLLYMFSTPIQSVSGCLADIDTQMKEREQGTVIVETVFCYLCH